MRRILFLDCFTSTLVVISTFGCSGGASQVTGNLSGANTEEERSESDPSPTASPSPSSSSTSSADTTPPQVSSISLTSHRNIQIIFNESVSSGATTASNYALSGSGMGTLSSQPDSVSGSGTTYTLTWSSGVMLNSSTATITVTGVQDAAGNTISGSNTASANTGTAVTTTTVASLSLDSGATSSNDLAVNVAFGAFGSTVTDVCLRNDATVGSCSWVATGSAPSTHNITSGLGSKSVTAYVRDAAGNIGSAADSITLSCADQFAAVPANGTYSTAEFCVAQFEMKAVLTSGPSIVADGGASGALNVSTHHAESRADGQPWVNITRSEMITECSNSSQFSGMSLITNPQWMAMARNLEQVASNWSGSAVGTGFVYRGHSDNSPTSPLQVTDTSDVYNQTGDSSMSNPEQRRRLTLSTGSTVWDVAGNVWEFTSTDVNMQDARYTPSLNFFNWPTTTNLEFSNATYFSSGNPNARLDFAPSNTSYDSNQGMGTFLGDTGTTNFMSRSGSFTDGSNAGIFRGSSWADLNASSRSNEVGFRCVYNAP